MKGVVLASLMLAMGAVAQDSKPGDTVPGVETMKTPAECPRVATWIELHLSPDNAWIYLWDAMNGKICRLKGDTLAIADEIDAGGVPGALALSPDGRMLYCVAVDSRFADKNAEGPFPCTIKAIDTAKFKVAFEFKLDSLGANDLCANDKGLLAATLPKRLGGPNGVAVIDVTQRKIVDKIDISNQGTGRGCQAEKPRLVSHPRGSHFYVACDYSPGRIQFKSKGPFDVWETSNAHGRPMAWNCVISPDGKKLITFGGCVFEEGGCSFEGKVDEFRSIAIPKDCETFIVAREEGKLRHYEMKTRKGIAAWRISGEAMEMAFDDKRRRIIALTIPLEGPGGLKQSRAQSYKVQAFEVPAGK